MVLICVLWGAFACSDVFPLTARVSRANYERLQIGMSQGQVEAILGKATLIQTGKDAHLLPGCYLCEWQGQGCLIEVHFDRTNRIGDKFWSGPTQSWNDILRQQIDQHFQLRIFSDQSLPGR